MAAAAGIGAATSILSGIMGGKGAKKAAKIQSAAMDKAMAQQQAQFDTTRGDFMPFLQGGTQALSGSGGIMDLLGLHGNDPMAAAIAQLKASPAFTSLYDTGADTILQNAAATGGVRGGNTQRSLADFGSNLLSTVIQNQLGSLGGLAGMGSGAAGSLGGFGAQNSAAISDLLTKQGAGNAAGKMAQYGFLSNTIKDVGGIAGSYGAQHGW